MLNLKRLLEKHWRTMLWLILIWALVIIVYLYLSQFDLMRHIFVTECHEIGDIWRVRFGFPLWNPWKPIWEVPIQVAFDITYAVIGLCVFFLGVICTHFAIKRAD